MVSELNMPHGKMSDCVYFPLFGFTLDITLRKLILKLIEILWYFLIRYIIRFEICQIEICLGFFCLIYIFWHYYRNSFELKKILLILRYIEILLYLKGYKGFLSQNQKVRNDFFGCRRYEALHSKPFLKKC